MRSNSMMKKFQHCQNKIQRARKRGTIFCWTCGHYALTIDKRCECCYGIITKPKKHDKILEIKTELEKILENKINPEYRFYIKNWCCFIKKSDLEEYEKLGSQEKKDRYFHWINSKLENDSIVRVFH